MGAAHSVDSCSSGKEQKKDDIFTIPSAQELADYHQLEQAQQQQQQQHAKHPHPKKLPRAMPDASASVQRKLGIDATAVDEELLSSLPNRNHHHHSHGRLSSSISKIRHKSMRRVRQASSSVIGKVSHAASAVSHSSRRLFHPHGHHHRHHNNHHAKRHVPVVAPKVKGGVLLRGCHTDEEHRQKARAIVEMLRPLKGEEALRACGFEYRQVKLDENGEVEMPIQQTPEMDDDYSYIEAAESSYMEEQLPDLSAEMSTLPLEKALSFKKSETADETVDAEGTRDEHHCKSSNTMITAKNRKEFIADGDMYDAIARITQEYAQDIMAQIGDLEWTTICEAGNNPEPIRALVSRRLVEDETRLDQEPTLLIATGKGKVRAGIFSRQHLLMSGLECSTAVPIVREAKKRNMLMVIVDPNVHGDRLGMATFEKTMACLFKHWERNDSKKLPPLSQRDLFVLSHSQSGAQLARYLLDKPDDYLPHLRAIAFTDSTHNIQWAKSKNLNNLREFLESDDCVYFRCSKEENNEPLLNPLTSLGEEVDTDEFWKHRFGNIKTICAGTSEHSLTNWFARCHIWEHFDRRLNGAMNSVGVHKKDSESEAA